MKKLATILVFAFTIFSTTTFATTWDEPWQDKVIKEADSFVLAKIISYDRQEGATIKIIKSLGGKELKGKLKITDFYLLELCSSSGGHGAEFNFDDMNECYIFIKKNDKGKYCIATPTTGFNVVVNGNVFATYRHSYHQALVPADTYEKTMTAIFDNYHNIPYDKLFINEYVNKYLSLKPAGLNESEINTFFAQHVALECAYHLRLTGLYSKITPFINDTSNFHNQVSGARALISYNTDECKHELLKVISDTTRSHFVQVLCVWTLSEFKPKELKNQLIKISEKASTAENGFGGNIMDPRICTDFPNVKKAITKLTDTL
ncbi:MAG: hypothetical protein PHT07_07445 [Paludibacter sp.]|nr:hypothetical protein [Paludibacter sp.]